MTKNIGLQVKVPKSECNDDLCPFHGVLSVRGKLVQGKVVSAKGSKNCRSTTRIPKI